MSNPTKGKTRKSPKSVNPAERRKLLQTDKRLEKVQTDFRVLCGACGMIGQCPGGAKTFEKVLNLIGKSVEFSHASLFLLDKESNRMQEVVSVGKTVDLIDFVRFDSGVGLSAWVAQEKRPILLSNLHRKRGGETVKSFLAVPLTLEGELFGVMNLGHMRAHAFEPADVEFLQMVSAPISLSLEKMQYHSELEKLGAELRDAGERSAQLEQEVARLRSMIPTSQLLESLSQKITSPLSEIVENAQFLLEGFSPRPEDKKGRSKRGTDVDLKRGLRQIRNEAKQVTKATERLL